MRRARHDWEGPIRKRSASATMAELRFTKDAIPIYDGNPDLYVSYRRAALVYAETLEWKKRSLVGPRLQAALEGSAKVAVEHMPPGWVSHDKGAVQLLDFLKSQVRAPTLAEAGRSISRFFYGIKRRKGEGMAAWVVRHDEALMEAKRTLAEAIQEYGQIPKRSPTTRSSPPMSSGRMSSGGAQGGRWQDEQAEGTATPEANSYAADDDTSPTLLSPELLHGTDGATTLGEDNSGGTGGTQATTPIHGKWPGPMKNVEK